MKLSNSLKLAAIVTAGLFASQSFALPVSTAPDLVVNISGASAQQKTLGKLLAANCNGDLTTYLDDPGGTASVGKKWRSYYCTLKTGDANIPDNIEGLKVLFNNRSGGGSIWGVVPVARGWAVEYLNIFSGNCTSTGTGTETCTWQGDRADGILAFSSGIKDTEFSSGAECPFVAFTKSPGTPPAAENYAVVGGVQTYSHTGTDADSTVCLKSDGGVSDVEPALFDGNNFPGFTGGALTSADPVLTVNSEYGVVFGVSVTDDIYRRLQEDQFPCGVGQVHGVDCISYPAPTGGVAAHSVAHITQPGAETVSTTHDVAPVGELKADPLRPTLSAATVASLMSDKLESWSAVDSTLFAGVDQFALCRRVVGSGTQAAQNVKFMRDPCSITPLAMQSAGGTGCVFAGGNIVCNNSGSGDVIDCQNDAMAGTLSTAGLFGSSDERAAALGFNAIEKTPDPDHLTEPDYWHYVKLDGIDPTVENARSGDYDHWYEQTIQWPTASTSGLVLDALNMVKDQSGNPTVIASAGLTAVAALPTIGTPPNDWETTQTMRGSRGGNSCKPAVLEADD